MSNEFSMTSDVPDGFETFFLEDAESSAEADLIPDDDSEDYYRTKTSSSVYEYDIAVIGSGAAGYAAAVYAAQRGIKVIIFEKDMLGGPGLTSGDVPRNIYMNVAGVFRTTKSSAAYGITNGDDVQIDLKKIIAFKDNAVSKIVSDATRLLRSCRIRMETGEASLKSAHEIHCRGRIYNVSKIILCSGSRIVLPEIPGLSHPGVLNPEEVFKLSEVPSRLLILGGGARGCEIAAAFATFGSNVMLVEQEDRLVPGMDAQVAEALQQTLLKTGVKVYTGIYVNEIQDRDGNPFVVTGRGGVLCDKVVIASGSKPDLSSLGALVSEIGLNGDAIKVNEYLETNLSGIYAAGDITGLDCSASAACRMGETAASNAIGENRTIDLSALPKVIFMMPCVAAVGLSEEEARSRYGDDLIIGCSPLEDNMRAILTGRTEGFVKVLAGRKYGEIYGVHIVSAEAAEMIAEPAALMKMEVTIYEIVHDILHVRTTCADAFRAACAAALKGIAETGRNRI